MAFEGPLFIVGLSRSGTSLLRNLLNGNSRISMIPAESHFIPFLIRKYGKTPDFSSHHQIESVKQDLEKTLFFRKMAANGCFVDWASLMKIMKTQDWDRIIRYIFQRFAAEPYKPGMIWGDKTPRYLPYLPEIKGILPDARFIHIIRDPRDRAMSVHARWKKTYLRSAWEWNRQLTLSRDYLKIFGVDYTELFYEDLITEPKKALIRLCKFVEVSFEPEMLTLKNAEHQHGDTKGAYHVVSGNCNKFTGRLSKKRIRRIEEIAYPMMRELGYPITVATEHVPVGKVRKLFVRMFDIVFHVWAIFREFGIAAGIKRALQVFKARILFRFSVKRKIQCGDHPRDL